ncbi:hypothetical protein JT55_10265 [Rhodovulum sp. NI22]|nr:hypothetical protein JT55_10265 [Rhodovulum sp. NI22]
MTAMQKPVSTGIAEPCPLHDDLLEGAEAIADFMFGTTAKRRKVYHLASTSRLPVFRLGSVLCARKSKILVWIEEQEAQNTGGQF